jgi:hypothetical protein
VQERREALRIETSTEVAHAPHNTAVAYCFLVCPHSAHRKKREREGGSVPNDRAKLRASELNRTRKVPGCGTLRQRVVIGQGTGAMRTGMGSSMRCACSRVMNQWNHGAADASDICWLSDATPSSLPLARTRSTRSAAGPNQASSRAASASDTVSAPPRSSVHTDREWAADQTSSDRGERRTCDYVAQHVIDAVQVAAHPPSQRRRKLGIRHRGVLHRASVSATHKHQAERAGAHQSPAASEPKVGGLLFGSGQAERVQSITVWRQTQGRRGGRVDIHKLAALARILKRQRQPQPASVRPYDRAI